MIIKELVKDTKTYLKKTKKYECEQYKNFLKMANKGWCNKMRKKTSWYLEEVKKIKKPQWHLRTWKKVKHCTDKA